MLNQIKLSTLYSLPVLLFLLAIIVFILVLLVKKKNPLDNIINYIFTILTCTAFSLFATILVVAIFTIIYSSPQGPLVLIDYIPVAAMVGEVLGVLVWYLKKTNMTK